MRFLLLFLILTQCAWSSGWQQDQSVYNVQVSGKINTYQTTAPTVSSCGTSPSVATRSSDVAGTVTIGSGVVTSCKVSFASSYTNAPVCVLLNKSVNPYVTSETATTDTAAIYIQSPGQSLAGTSVNWICVGNQ